MKQIFMDGYVCGRVETKSTASGKHVTVFGVNSPERKQNKQTGEWESVPQFFDCQYWHRSDRDFRVPQIAEKAHLVLVGEPRYESWEKNGEKSSKVLVNVRDLWAIEKADKSFAGLSYGGGNGEPEYTEAFYYNDDLPF